MTTEAQDRIRQSRIDDHLRGLLATEPGRRTLWWLIDERAGIGTTESTYCGADTHRSAYLEGRRAERVEMLRECQRVGPSESVQMMAEATRRRAAEHAELTDGGRGKAD